MEIDKISQQITLFEQSSLTSMEIESEEGRVAFERDSVTSKAPPAIEVKEIPETHKIIKSPIVATFYRTPSPDAPPYVEVGSRVRVGEPLCTLEAMKLMNQLEAEWECEVVAVLAEHATLVEFGQPLFEVRLL